MRLSLSKAFSILCISWLLYGCGYGFQGSGSILPPDVKKIYIPTSENLTSDITLTVIVTEAMRDRFDRFGVLTVVDEQRDADAVLKMTIVSLKKDTAATASGGTNAQLEQDAIITLAGELKKTTGEVLWRNTGFTMSRAFSSTSGVVVTNSADFAAAGPSVSDLAKLGNREVSRGQEKQTYEAIAQDAAKRVYDEAVSPDF